jgi:hypothetical protein
LYQLLRLPEVLLSLHRVGGDESLAKLTIKASAKTEQRFHGCSKYYLRLRGKTALDENDGTLDAADGAREKDGNHKPLHVLRRDYHSALNGERMIIDPVQLIEQLPVPVLRLLHNPLNLAREKSTGLHRLLRRNNLAGAYFISARFNAGLIA